MPNAVRGVGTVRRSASEKVAVRLRSTWTVGKRIFQAGGQQERAWSVGRPERQATWEQRVGEREDARRQKREMGKDEHAGTHRSAKDFDVLFQV